MKMRVDTEWRLGVLAMIVNMWCVLIIVLLALLGFDTGIYKVKEIFCFGGVYIITLGFLYKGWLDKFNYIED